MAFNSFKYKTSFIAKSEVELVICNKTLVTGCASMHQLVAGAGMSIVPMISTSGSLSHKAGTMWCMILEHFDF